jgi:hypothetical protein
MDEKKKFAGQNKIIFRRVEQLFVVSKSISVGSIPTPNVIDAL